MAEMQKHQLSMEQMLKLVDAFRLKSDEQRWKEVGAPTADVLVNRFSESLGFNVSERHVRKAADHLGVTLGKKVRTVADAAQRKEWIRQSRVVLPHMAQVLLSLCDQLGVNNSHTEALGRYLKERWEAGDKTE